MIGCRRRPGKETWNKFAPPPWERTSADWLKIDEQLEADHLARLIDRGVERLDLTALLESYAGRGSKACRPDLMLKIALFEIQRGRAGPALWYLDAKENVAVQWLGFGIRPARSVWYEFAFRIHRSLDGWNREILHEAPRARTCFGPTRCLGWDRSRSECLAVPAAQPRAVADAPPVAGGGAQGR
jgi:hypothetical protein